MARGKQFKVEFYKDTTEDINPLYAEYPKHNVPHIDMFLMNIERFQLWQNTRLFSMGFICMFPILGQLLALKHTSDTFTYISFLL